MIGKVENGILGRGTRKEGSHKSVNPTQGTTPLAEYGEHSIILAVTKLKRKDYLLRDHGFRCLSQTFVL